MFITCPAAIHQHNGLTKDSRETCSVVHPTLRTQPDQTMTATSYSANVLPLSTYSAAAEVQKMRCTPTGGITSWDWSHFKNL